MRPQSPGELRGCLEKLSSRSRPATLASSGGGSDLAGGLAWRRARVVRTCGPWLDVEPARPVHRGEVRRRRRCTTALGDLVGVGHECLPIVERSRRPAHRARPTRRRCHEPAVGHRDGAVVGGCDEAEGHERRAASRPGVVEPPGGKRSASSSVGSTTTACASPSNASSSASTPMTASRSRPCSHWSRRSAMPASEWPSLLEPRDQAEPARCDSSYQPVRPSSRGGASRPLDR